MPGARLHAKAQGVAAHDQPQAPTTTDPRWWGPLALPDAAPARRVQIGPLRLGLARAAGELSVRCGWGHDPLEAEVHLDPPGDGESFFPADAKVTRYALSGRGVVEARLIPALADLPVVTRPEHPFTLLPGESATIYVGTPVLLRLDVADKRVAEMPLARLRRTWFGTPEVGELAYASRTYCRMTVEELDLYPHRATTAVRLKNGASTALDLVRLMIPVPNLSLGVDEEGRLWTDDLQLVRASGDPYAPLELDPGTWRRPRPDVEVLAEPRVPLGGTNLLRLLAPIF